MTVSASEKPFDDVKTWLHRFPAGAVPTVAANAAGRAHDGHGPRRQLLAREAHEQGAVQRQPVLIDQGAFRRELHFRRRADRRREIDRSGAPQIRRGYRRG